MGRISKENYYLDIAETVLGDATSCAMCRRQVINAGISKVVIRKTDTEFEVVDVQDWVQQEDDVPAL